MGVASALVGVWALLTVWPETLLPTAMRYVGPVPLNFVAFYLAGLALAAGYLARSRGHGRWLPWALLIWTLLAVHGAVAGHPLKWWVIDASIMASLPLGMIWARHLWRGEWPRVFAGAVWLIALLLAGTMLGLWLGVVPRGAVSTRLYTYSLFDGAFILTWLLATRILSMPSRRPTWRDVAPLGVGSVLVLAVALFSATRSTLALFALLVAMVGWRLVRGRGWAALLLMMYLLTCGLLLVSAWSSAMDRIAASGLARRTATLDWQQDPRLTELQLLWRQSRDSVWFGDGFGSRYITAWRHRDGSQLALAPHIGAVAFWFKGGIAVFVLFIVWPFLRSILTLFLHPPATRLTAGAGGVLAYLAVASVSGGWSLPTLFLLGASLAWLTQRENSESVVPT